jgi:cytochrome b561
MSRSDRSTSHYTATAIVLHWLVAAVLLADFAWGWWMQEIPKQPPGIRADAFNLHKSIGLTLLLLMIARLAWRLRHPPPALPPMPAWQAAFAHANHRVMYVATFVLAIGGYLGSAWSGYPVRFFGVVIPAWSASKPALKDLASVVHLAASWILLVAVTLHVAGALKHALVDRNGILTRIVVPRRRDAS